MLYQEVLTALRSHIVQGGLPEGHKIVERNLCNLFKVSRTPLREALKVLASEGIVELVPNCSARVRARRTQDLQELFDVMEGLEALSGRLACENITDAEIAEIERLHHEMYGFYLRKDTYNYFRMSRVLHRKMLKASRNRALQATYDMLAARTPPPHREEASPDEWRKIIMEQEAILDALRRRASFELSELLLNRTRHNRYKAGADRSGSCQKNIE